LLLVRGVGLGGEGYGGKGGFCRGEMRVKTFVEAVKEDCYHFMDWVGLID